MLPLQRPLSIPTDLSLLLALAGQFPSDHLHVIDLPYRLSSWACQNPGNTNLWFDEDGKLLAWAVLNTPFWTLDYVCSPVADPDLYPQILNWAGERAFALLGTEYGQPSWFVNVFAGQTERIRQLEDAGFRCQSDLGENSWSKVLMRRPGSEPAAVYRPPAGFTVRSLAGESEAQAYVDLHRAVFETKNMTLDWRLRTLSSPAHTPDLDIVIESPDGRLGAFCVGWLSRRPDDALMGQIEPLGCHKDYRRYALGRVALAEVLRRMQAKGAEEIFVETDNYRDNAFRLYEWMGFQVLKDVLVFRKNYGVI